jgi:methyltransferase (TIGR00027 family)
MRAKRASRTSSLVTMMRAFGNEGITEVRDFKDPTAYAMLPLPWKLLTRVALRRLRSKGRSHLYYSNGHFDMVPLRTRVLDEAWRTWATAHAGARQLVLLGAGLDGRAYRLPDLGETTPFEVDHPATQALKRKRAQGLRLLAGKHVYVPVNFEADSLATALARAGLDRTAPSFWIWEGVMPYLTREAQVATLAAIATSSSPGSRLAMTYVEPGDGKDIAQTRRLVKFLGEPFVGLRTRAELAEMLNAAGFDVVEDSGIPEWRKLHTDAPPRPEGTFYERIAVAERR